MHLEDPALAIREMYRVVRPGGRVVVAEVYASAARIAHPDPEAERLISAELVFGMRNTWMGIGVRGTTALDTAHDQPAGPAGMAA